MSDDIDVGLVYPEFLKREEKQPPQKGIGLCLSGGGFRATLYNLGSLWRLNEFGLLPKLSVITSVSGGSIVSSLLGLKWSSLDFDPSGRAGKFVELVAEPIRDFCKRDIAGPAVFQGLVNPFKSIGDEMVEYYEDLYGKATLQDLPDDAIAPQFLIYATSLQSGVSVRMTRRFLWDYKVGRVLSPTVGLAQAVAASSAFPPFLSPNEIEINQPWQTTTGATLTTPEYRDNLVLTDGGVYDNMGLEAVWDRYQTVLVSDAGAPLLPEVKPKSDWLRMSTRVMDIVTEQTRALRKRRLIDDFKQAASGRVGAYWGIRSSIVDYGFNDPMTQDSDLTRSLALVRTHLNAFADEEQGHLINWGYAMCDLAIRKWLPHLGTNKGSWPVPEYPL